MHFEAIYPVILSAALAYWANRLQSACDKSATEAAQEKLAAQAVEVRLARVEEKFHSMAGRVTRTEEIIEDVRENMVRRADLTALGESLGQRLEDVVKYLHER